MQTKQVRNDSVGRGALAKFLEKFAKSEGRWKNALKSKGISKDFDEWIAIAKLKLSSNLVR